MLTIQRTVKGVQLKDKSYLLGLLLIVVLSVVLSVFYYQYNKRQDQNLKLHKNPDEKYDPNIQQEQDTQNNDEYKNQQQNKNNVINMVLNNNHKYVLQYEPGQKELFQQYQQNYDDNQYKFQKPNVQGSLKTFQEKQQALFQKYKQDWLDIKKKLENQEELQQSLKEQQESLPKHIPSLIQEEQQQERQNLLDKYKNCQLDQLKLRQDLQKLLQPYQEGLKTLLKEQQFEDQQYQQALLEQYKTDLQALLEQCQKYPEDEWDYFIKYTEQLFNLYQNHQQTTELQQYQGDKLIFLDRCQTKEYRQKQKKLFRDFVPKQDKQILNQQLGEVHQNLKQSQLGETQQDNNKPEQQLLNPLRFLPVPSYTQTPKEEKLKKLQEEIDTLTIQIRNNAVHTLNNSQKVKQIIKNKQKLIQLQREYVNIQKINDSQEKDLNKQYEGDHQENENINNQPQDKDENIEKQQNENIQKINDSQEKDLNKQYEGDHQENENINNGGSLPIIEDQQFQQLKIDENKQFIQQPESTQKNPTKEIEINNNLIQTLHQQIEQITKDILKYTNQDQLTLLKTRLADRQQTLAKLQEETLKQEQQQIKQKQYQNDIQDLENSIIQIQNNINRNEKQPDFVALLQSNLNHKKQKLQQLQQLQYLHNKYNQQL